MARLSFPPSTTSKTKLTHNGRTLTLMQWAKKEGIRFDTLRARYEKGIRGDSLFSKTHLNVGHHRGVKHCAIYQGETISLRELAKKVDLRYDTLRQRVISGVVGDDLVSPQRITKTNVTKELITYQGATRTLKEWSAHTGIKFPTLRARYVRGLRGDELFMNTKPARFV